MLAAVRSRVGVYGIVLVFVVAVTILAIVGYRIYSHTLAATPDKAVAAYLDTLNKGDTARLYDLTLGASGQSQAEFSARIGALINGKRLSTEGEQAELIGRQGNLLYYRVNARLTTADGSFRRVPILLEAAQEDNSWRVRLYVPPAAFPAGPTGQ